MAGRKDAKEKQREKEHGRKKRGSRKYGQAKQKHSRMGVHSLIYAGLSLSLLLICILIAFVMKGNTFSFIGGLGIVSMVLAIFGIRASVKGMREREKRYITCKLGIAGNILILLGLISIFVGGLM
ncbi:DUF6142 family protein [Luxibacter massiliensis]|uniref:DUF6142 family protein n=1 Tax=Luxibacter massiliensis TaxID=2219695 RepID=UPI000F0563EC|nr:DUF6142 family protein [Luxibacter massiliensis]